MSPSSPSASWLGPAVKYKAPGVTLSEPAGNRSPHSPEMVIGPRWVRSWPRNWPVAGLKALIRPSPKLPTRMSPPKAPKAAGASVTAHGELSGPWLASRCSRVPSGAKTSTKPLPGPASSSCLAASCLAKVTYRLPPMLWMPNGAKPAEMAVEDLDGAEPEVGGVQELAGRGADQGESLVFRAVVAGPVGDGGPVHGDDRAGGIDGGVPAGDRAVLGGEQEPGGGGDTVPGYQETIWRGVEYGAVGRAGGSGPGRPRRRDGHHELPAARPGLGVALPVVQGGCPGVVVGHPDRQARAGGGAPGVPQVRVGVPGQAGNVGDQVGLPVGRAGDRTGGRGARRQAGQAERAAGEERHDGGGPHPFSECHHSPFGVAGSVEPAVRAERRGTGGPGQGSCAVTHPCLSVTP